MIFIYNHVIMAAVYSIKAFPRKWTDNHTNWTISMDNRSFKKPGKFLKTFSVFLQADTDLLMCVSDQSESGHYYAGGRFTPTMTTPVRVFVCGSYQVKNKNYYRR